ncbi:hypothetical protein AOZ07_15740 [Glutamicibacter halophytocola]|nr:hypothetical protein AOZ07_15740 [Glutamicibacter halophytocola]
MPTALSGGDRRGKLGDSSSAKLAEESGLRGSAQHRVASGLQRAQVVAEVAGLGHAAGVAGLG